jgi:hypothetical protein
LNLFVSPCAGANLDLTQKVIQITQEWHYQGVVMKMKPMLLLATLLLSALPTLSQAEGAPAMPMVVCHVDKAPQMLVPDYVCRWQGGSVHY